jgi:hypothetical protein
MADITSWLKRYNYNLYSYNGDNYYEIPHCINMSECGGKGVMFLCSINDSLPLEQYSRTVSIVNREANAIQSVMCTGASLCIRCFFRINPYWAVKCPSLRYVSITDLKTKYDVGVYDVTRYHYFIPGKLKVAMVLLVAMCNTEELAIDMGCVITDLFN